MGLARAMVVEYHDDLNEVQGDPSLARLLAVIDQDKITLVAFGAGYDPYKRDWMERVRTRYSLELLRPGQARN